VPRDGCGPRRGVDQHLDRRADQGITTRCGDLVLQLAQFGEPLAHQGGIDAAVEVGGIGAVLAAVGEEAAPVELRLLDEVEELVVVGFGLAGIPDDEVAAERRVGFALTDLRDSIEESLPVAPAAHPAQQRLADVLQREVEVRHARVADRIDQVVAQVARVQVQQPHPIDLVGDGPDERDDRAGAQLAGAILAVRGEVLGDEHDLTGFELVDLGEDRCDVAAALRAAETRDGTEPAGAVAALGDLHVGPRHRRLRTGQVEQVEFGQRRARHGDQLATRCGTMRHLGAVTLGRRHVERLAETGDLVDLRKRRCQFLAVPFGHAAGDDEAGTVAALPVECEDRVDRLASRVVDECAGVHDDQVGKGSVVGGLHAVREERADQLVGIDVVLRAAERLDVEPLGHDQPRYPAPCVVGRPMGRAGPARLNGASSGTSPSGGDRR
jgi:hypothetical protein